MFLVIFAALELLAAALDQKHQHPVLQTACWLLLLLLALAIHEIGHATMATWLGYERDEIRLWPFGNFVSPMTIGQSADKVAVALAGPAASLAMALSTAVALHISGAQFVWSPFGNEGDVGAPKILPAGTLAFFPDRLWYLGWFGYLNWLIFLVNLIPALPFDGGRVVHALLSGSTIVPARDNLLGPWIARSAAGVLVLVGLVRLLFYGNVDQGWKILLLALLIEFMVRSEARLLEDGGFLEDGVFGYDFSEGYTSLESSAAKVRPYRESALTRWRRSRSERRRQRQQEREAAEERRMDEILAKLYSEGRSALSDEEHRFLIRVSVKYRNRARE
jgi:Zn-dependent protease